MRSRPELALSLTECDGPGLTEDHATVGAGFNWGKPNGGGRDQYTTELFWRYQLTKELAVTPSLQYIIDPALNPSRDNLFAFGLRVRVVL